VAIAAAGDGVLARWRLDDVGKPHALALGAAPARLTGAGERVLALYYGEVADAGSRLRKYIVLHPGMPHCRTFYTTNPLHDFNTKQ